MAEMTLESLKDKLTERGTMITLHNKHEGTKANIKALPDGTFIIDMIAITEDSNEHVLWTYRIQTMEEAMSKVVGFITGQKSVVLREPLNLK